VSRCDWIIVGTFGNRDPLYQLSSHGLNKTSWRGTAGPPSLILSVRKDSRQPGMRGTVRHASMEHRPPHHPYISKLIQGDNPKLLYMSVRLLTLARAPEVFLPT